MENNSTIGQDWKVIQQKLLNPMGNWLQESAKSGNQNNSNMNSTQQALYERRYGKKPPASKTKPASSPAPSPSPSPQTKPPKSRTGNVETPTAYPTTAELKTIKSSRSYAPAAPPEDPSTRVNLDGVVQKGMQMSTLSDFNDMYERVVGKHNMSATAYNPFESVHLHTKGDNRDDMVNDGPHSYSADEAAAFNSGQGIEWSSDQKADAPYTIAKPADVTSTEGAPKIVQSGAGKVVKGVNGHEFGGDHEAPATMKRDRTSQLRRKWMMGDMKDENGNDLSNIQRLRGMRMEQGFDRQGDKYFARASLDPANKSKPTEISRDQYRQAIVSDAGAQQVAADLKDAYTSKIKEGNNITDSVQMKEDYMPEASPTAPLTNRQYKQDTDTDFDAMAEANPDGMTGVSKYKRY